MEETTKGDFFNKIITATDPAKGITTMDYLNALDYHVKKPLILVYDHLCGLLDKLPLYERETANDFLAVHRDALLVWHQIDERVLADVHAKYAKAPQ